MYLYKTQEEFTRDVDVEPPEDAELVSHWAKHPNLHGKIKDIYLRKGGKDSNFNSKILVLNRKDIKEIKTAIKHKSLPHTRGFFFGKSKDSDQQWGEDMTKMYEALDAIEDGYTIFYYSTH